MNVIKSIPPTSYTHTHTHTHTINNTVLTPRISKLEERIYFIPWANEGEVK